MNLIETLIAYFMQLTVLDEDIKMDDGVVEESLAKAVDSSESIPTAIPSVGTHTSSSKTAATTSSKSSSTSTSISTSASSSSQTKEKSEEKTERKRVAPVVDGKVERVPSPLFAPSVHEEQHSLKEPSLKHSGSSVDQRCSSPTYSIAGSLGDELDEDDRRTENDVSSLSDEAEPEALKSPSVFSEGRSIDDDMTRVLGAN